MAAQLYETAKKQIPDLEKKIEKVKRRSYAMLRYAVVLCCDV